MKSNNRTKRLTVFISVIFLIVIGCLLYYQEGTLPVDKSHPETKIFVVDKGMTLTQVSNKLAQQGFIRNQLVFYLVAKKLGIDRNIQAGDFRLSTNMNAYQIANNLTHGTQDLWVTLIEGTRKEEMAQVLAEYFNFPESQFIENAQEGYLFPDTYLIPREATAGSIIQILTSNFKKKFNTQLQKSGESKGLTPKQIVILASLVEKEARDDTDRQIVASILLKRLQNDWPLQVDATIQYALGYQPNEKTWWKKDLTSADLAIDSPYNTYTHPGLPPTPICNPGLASIRAVADANPNTPYWYYLSDRNGVMHYSKTLEEHNANIQKYLN